MKPIDKSDQVFVNLIYCAYSLLCATCIALSYNYRQSKMCILIPTVLLSFKCNFRVFDFEKTQNLMDKSDWEEISIQNSNVSETYFTLILLFFEAQQKTKFLVLIFHFLLKFYSLGYSSGSYKNSMIGATVIGYLLYDIIGNWHAKMINTMF